MRSRTEIPIEVRYAETDRMGVVHHANYLAWFELARTRLCEEAGHHYAAIEELGYWLVVSGATVRYRQGARYGETVTVSCELDWLGTRALEFGYDVTFPRRLPSSLRSRRPRARVAPPPRTCSSRRPYGCRVRAMSSRLRSPQDTG